MCNLAEVCRVSCVSQELIQVEVLDPVALKNQAGRGLTLGTYLKIADDDGHAVITVIQSYRIKDPSGTNALAPPGTLNFLLDTQPIGFLDAEGNFKRGGQQIAIPPTRVSIADQDTLRAIYASETEADLVIGTLVQDEAIDVPVNGDVFFGKHVAVVGSTGSGKSCTVARTDFKKAFSHPATSTTGAF